MFLQAEEERSVKIAIDEYATSFWDESEEKWCSEKGVYRVRVAMSGNEGLGKGEMVEADFEVLETRWWIGL